MLSTQSIIAINAEIAARAAELNLEPFSPWSLEEIDSLRQEFIRLIPNIGSLEVSDKWELVDTAQIDKTGIDKHGPALSLEGALAWVREKAEENIQRGFAFIEEGQFQIWLGVFDPK